jgi:hypothetical protein
MGYPRLAREVSLLCAGLAACTRPIDPPTTEPAAPTDRPALHLGKPAVKSAPPGAAPTDDADPQASSLRFPCPATAGSWTSCAIDRREAPGYAISDPDDLPLVRGVSLDKPDPMVTAAVGDLSGGLGRDIVFSDSVAAATTEDGGSNPGYLCVGDDGAYGPCPDALGLPTVEGQVMAVALEHIDGDERPDLLILHLEMATDEVGGAVREMLAGNEASVPLRLSLFSQERESDLALPHWVDRSGEVGLGEAFDFSCVAENFQLIDLDRDLVPEVVIGGQGCEPVVFAWDGGQLALRPGMLPAAVGTKAGVYTAPRPDGSQSLFLMSYDGAERGVPTYGGSTCWRGEPYAWTPVLCPAFGNSPMGLAFLDPDKDGRLEVASSDTNGDRFCAQGFVDDTVSIGCYESSWQLPGNFETLAGESRHSLSWNVGAWGDHMVQVQGFEHALEPDPDTGELIAWHDWPQQIHLYEASPDGAGWTRVHNAVTDADVQERGLVGPLDLNGDGCSDLLPLPVGLTDMRALIDGTCAVGTQEIAFRSGNQGAYGSEVVLLSDDGARQATVIGSTGGVAGFTPPVKSVGPDVTQLEIHWTSGAVSVVGRDAQGRFPDVIAPLTTAL